MDKEEREVRSVVSQSNSHLKMETGFFQMDQVSVIYGLCFRFLSFRSKKMRNH